MNDICDVAIIGAGPHGLSLAAHLRSRGIGFRIFGKPLSTWSQHMPKNMMLKSDGFASNLSAPGAKSTLKAYCAARHLPYADEGLPVSLDGFLAYANAFRQEHASNLEDVDVVWLDRERDDFVLTLETGQRIKARNVVLAVGITWFSHTPPVLSALPAAMASHSFNHREGDSFRNREVVIVGHGASAIDLALQLDEAGASVRVVARNPAIEFNKVPDPADDSSLGRLLRPASGIGRGWRSYFCARAPLLFHRLPENLRRRAIASHMHPAAGWFTRARVEGRIPMTLGRTLEKAEVQAGRVNLTLADPSGRSEALACDHVIAATGYRSDLRRLPFLAPALHDRIDQCNGSPALSNTFETSVKGLYAVGLPAMHNFGPLMRFMVGAEFAAPRLAACLERRLERKSATLMRAAPIKPHREKRRNQPLQA